MDTNAISMRNWNSHANLSSLARRRIEAGSSSSHVSAFWDLMPTLADLAGVEAPSNDGISFLPALLQEDQARHESLYWEFHNVRGSHSQAVDFLIVKTPAGKQYEYTMNVPD